MFLYLGMLLAIEYMHQITESEESKNKLMATEITARGGRGLNRLAAASAMNLLLEEEFKKAGGFQKYADSPEDTLGKTITALHNLGEKVLNRLAESIRSGELGGLDPEPKSTESPLDQSGVSFEDLIKDLPVADEDEDTLKN